MHAPGTVGKAYSDQLIGTFNTSELPELFKKEPKSAMGFVLANLKVVGEIDELEREIRAILDKLGITVDVPFFKSYSIEELVIGVKHYLIAWSTMKDLMAVLINTSLDLGIHSKDISFGMILRNQKVINTEIPTICAKHAKTINVSYTDKQRNDAIHRGKLLDEEINQFREKHNGLYGQRYSLLNLEPISEDDFNRKIKELTRELTELVKLKRTQYSEHFDRTLILNKDLAKELAKLSVQKLASGRV